MGVVLILDDGRSFGASTMGMGGAYDLIAAEITDRPARTRWLMDINERGAPFLDLDTRAFEEADRTAFWRGAVEAFARLERKFGPGVLKEKNAFAANCLHQLLIEKRKIDAGEPPADVHDAIWPIDLNDLWYSDEELAEARRKDQEQYRRWLEQQAKP